MVLLFDEFVVGRGFLLPAHAHDDGIDEIYHVHHRDGEVARLDIQEYADAIDGNPKPPLLAEHPNHQNHGYHLHHSLGRIGKGGKVVGEVFHQQAKANSTHHDDGKTDEPVLVGHVDFHHFVGFVVHVLRPSEEAHKLHDEIVDSHAEVGIESGNQGDVNH